DRELTSSQLSSYRSRQRLVCTRSPPRNPSQQTRKGRQLRKEIACQWAPAGFVAGVDTHADTHTLAVCTAAGSEVFTKTFTADAAGYRELIAALATTGEIAAVGVEGTGSYGAGLARALAAAGFEVREVLRPSRQVRRLQGKSDPID